MDPHKLVNLFYVDPVQALVESKISQDLLSFLIKGVESFPASVAHPGAEAWSYNISKTVKIMKALF